VSVYIKYSTINKSKYKPVFWFVAVVNHLNVYNTQIRAFFHLVNKWTAFNLQGEANSWEEMPEKRRATLRRLLDLTQARVDAEKKRDEKVVQLKKEGKRYLEIRKSVEEERKKVLEATRNW